MKIDNRSPVLGEVRNIRASVGLTNHTDETNTNALKPPMNAIKISVASETNILTPRLTSTN